MSEQWYLRGSAYGIALDVGRVPGVVHVEIVAQPPGDFTVVVEGGDLDEIRQAVDDSRPCGTAFEVIQWPEHEAIPPAPVVQRPPWWRRLWASVSRWASR